MANLGYCHNPNPGGRLRPIVYDDSSRRYLLYWGLIGWTLAVGAIGWLRGGCK